MTGGRMSYFDELRQLEDERDHLDDAPDWPPYGVCAFCGPLTYVSSQMDHAECGGPDPDAQPLYNTSGPRRGLRVDARLDEMADAARELGFSPGSPP